MPWALDRAFHLSGIPLSPTAPAAADSTASVCAYHFSESHPEGQWPEPATALLAGMRSLAVPVGRQGT